MVDFLSSEKLSLYSRLGIAHAVIFFLFLLGLISYSIPFSDATRPYFIIISIYFWAIYRPTLLPIAYVFILGLLFDFILNYPVGLHALLFVAVQWGIRDQRLFFLGQPYMIVLIGFAFTCFAVLLSEWLFFSLLLGRGGDFNSVIYGTLISTLIFPIVTLLFNMIYRILPPAPQPHLL